MAGILIFKLNNIVPEWWLCSAEPQPGNTGLAVKPPLRRLFFASVLVFLFHQRNAHTEKESTLHQVLMWHHHCKGNRSQVTVSLPRPRGEGFYMQFFKKKNCTCTSSLDIFSVQHFSRMKHKTLFKSDKQGVFGKINRTVSCVLYLWSAAFPWQLGAMGFNYHRSVKGPCSTGAGRGTAAAPPACPSLPHDCLQRARGSGQSAHQRAKTGVEQGNRGEAQSWPSLGEMTDDAHLPKPPPQSQGCSASEGDRRKEGLSAQR